MAQKLEAIGDRGGWKWDDGGSYENVKKVYVGLGDTGVVYVKFDYEKDGKIIQVEHGKKTLLGTKEFEIDPEDYITSVKVYLSRNYELRIEFIRCLIFKTFKGKTSPQFGIPYGNDTDELGGGKIVGFHGSGSCEICSLGAYVVPSNHAIQARGGDAGVSWDDGFHDTVKKIYIGQGFSCVIYFKAEYQKASNLVLGSDHGKEPLIGSKEFVLDAGEYVTAVTGYYAKIRNIAKPVIVSLKFKTNKRTSSLYGCEGQGTEFVLEKQGHKIVGFHGQTGDYLYKFGVNVTPIAN